MFGRRPLRQFPDDRQNVRLIMAGLNHHEDRNPNDCSFQNTVEPHKMIRQGHRQRTHHPLHHQPRCKKIQSLKCMKSHHMVSLELPRSQHDNRRNPANRRDVTKDGSSPRRQTRQRICPRSIRGRTSTRPPAPRRRICLFGTATGAKHVRRGCLMTALCAEGHVY